MEITVAGHTISVKAAEPMAAVAAQALELFRQTAGHARRAPVGFDVGGGQFELAGEYQEPGAGAPGEDDRGA